MQHANGSNGSSTIDTLAESASPRGAIGLAAAAYLAACVYLWTQQRALIFQPDAAVLRAPGDLGVEFWAIPIPVGDRGVIQAWWLPTDTGASAAGTVRYLWGNDGYLGTEVERLGALHRHGLRILAIGDRGYGRSSGPAPSELQVYEDGTAAWDHLVREQGVDPRRIILDGPSLGGAVAAEVALRRGPACGIVFEGTLTTMAQMGRLAYPLIPVDGLLRERFDTLSKIARLDWPTGFVHRAADAVMPVAMSARPYRAARGDRQLVLIAGAGHENALPAGGAPFSAGMARLVRRCGGGRRRRVED